MEAIQKRVSVRSYDSRPIPDEVLNRVLESARIAPSAMNYQPWHFIVVKDAEKRKILSEGRYAKFLTQSPVVIVGCSNQKKSPKWAVVDVTIALQNMVLAATGEGLGTCWIGSFDEDRVKDALKVPEDYAVVAMLSMGYPKDKETFARPPRAKSRKALEDIVSYEEFGKR
ncbi:MAG: nitroreductase family protein [Thermoplasmata archaeon]